MPKLLHAQLMIRTLQMLICKTVPLFIDYIYTHSSK